MIKNKNYQLSALNDEHSKTKEEKTLFGKSKYFLTFIFSFLHFLFGRHALLKCMYFFLSKTKKRFKDNPLDKKLILVEPSAIFEQGIIYAREKGFSPILFTRLEKYNPNFCSRMDTSNFEKVYSVDTFSLEAMYKLVNKLNINVGAIIAHRDEVLLPAARLAKKLGLPHVSIEGLKNAYRKDKIRNILGKNGIKQPKYKIIDIFSTENPKIKYPLVIKPVNDSGADGAYLCKNEKEYQNAIRKIQHNQFTWLGAKREAILVEEFIDGPFYAAELLWNNGKWNILGFSKLYIDPNKSLCMTGISFPSDIHPNLLSSIEKEVIQWVNLVKLKGGALCIEFKLYKNIPYLIEINPRLAGPNVNKQILLALGISPVEYIIDEACGSEKKLILNNRRKVKLYVADAFVFPKKSGILYEINMLKCNQKDCISINKNFKKLPKKINVNQHFGNIVCHVIISGKNANDAMYKASKIASKIELKIK